MRYPWRKVAAAGLIALLAACNGVPVNMADRTVTDRSQIDPYRGRRVSAEATGFQLLLFFPIGVNDRQRKAYDALLRQAGPDHLLADVTVTESWRYAFIGTLYTTTITATAYPRKGASADKPQAGSTR